MTTSTDFGQTYFAAAPLGHKKRVECLIKIANRIQRHPGGTLPEKLHEPKDYKAMDRLMNRKEVTHDSVLAAPREHTLSRMRQAAGPVLILHDTTELDYSGLHSITDLGPIGSGTTRGLLCHNSLAVDLQHREVLGLVNQILHRRKQLPNGSANEPLGEKRDRETRESRLWVRGTQAIGPTPAGQQWIHVGDRGADIFEFLANMKTKNQEFLVRSSKDRLVHVGHQGTNKRVYLHRYMQSITRFGKKTVKVSGQQDRPERNAEVSIGCAPVLLALPRVRRGNYEEKPLKVWAIIVREDQPPKGIEPLEWILLSSVETRTTTDAWERGSWYECRWMVEEYHKAMKTGCGIENLQFCSSQALEPMIALLSVVATTLLNLREASRREDAKVRPATEVVNRKYVLVLSGWRLKVPSETWSVYDFFMALARLGGHQNRKSDRLPGWLVLWKGWMALQHMVDGAEAVGFK